jgi:uncharacterized protein with GYD domain
LPFYLVLGNWTDQGVKNARDAPNRIKETHKAVAEAGGKMQLYYTLGEYDFVMIIEVPDDKSLVKILIWLGSKGNVRPRTLKAWTEEIIQNRAAQQPRLSLTAFFSSAKKAQRRHCSYLPAYSDSF